MFTKILCAATFAALAHANTEIASTCLAEEAHLYGTSIDSDLPFTDYTFLSNSEQNNTVYRMTRFVLCSNSSGKLTGMRSIVTRFDADTMEALSIISMNRIGTITGDGQQCRSMTLDAPNGEYLTKIELGHSEPGIMAYAKATTNMDQTLAKGTLTDSMTLEEMKPIADKRILAFHGMESNLIASVGQVSVDLSCIKGVTTVETVEEPTLIDIENLNNDASAEPVATWVYILIGALLGVGFMALALGTFFMYKKKMGCFKGIAGNKTANIEDVTDFKGMSEDQKRRSIKQMSKIVELSESAGDIESDNNASKKNNGDNVISMQHGVPSLQSLAQMTDTEDQTHKQSH